MRTRFAPSPTGFLHVGGLRTALYAWLLAKQTGGSFALRIEDTDQAREVPGATEAILRALEWAGIPPDEGVVFDKDVVSEKGARGPYKQSERLSIYRKYADQLLESGHAYPCFCTTQRLDEMRKKQQELHQAPMYDRHCLRLKPDEVKARVDAGEPHVVRMKVPHDETIAFTDEVRGLVSFQGHTIDDQVLLKSDGFPTYHLAHVVDDHLMEFDIVTRAEEWLSSLPKHLLLFRMLGWQPPKYAHFSLLLNKDKTKLSKRQNSVSVDEYIGKGYLPEVMVNFLAMLGWNPGTTQEVFSLDELTKSFSLDRLQKSGAIFDLEKLDWLQGQWIRRIPAEEFAERIRDIVARQHPAAKADKDFVAKAKLIQERITFFHEAPGMLGYFYSDPTPNIDLLANAKQKVTKEDLPRLFDILEDTLSQLPEWSEAAILAAVRARMETENVKLGQLLWPLRALLTGRDYSPGAVELAAALGRETTMRRLKAAKESL